MKNNEMNASADFEEFDILVNNCLAIEDYGKVDLDHVAPKKEVSEMLTMIRNKAIVCMNHLPLNEQKIVVELLQEYLEIVIERRLSQSNDVIRNREIEIDRLKELSKSSLLNSNNSIAISPAHKK